MYPCNFVNFSKKSGLPPPDTSKPIFEPESKPYSGSYSNTEYIIKSSPQPESKPYQIQNYQTTTTYQYGGTGAGGYGNTDDEELRKIREKYNYSSDVYAPEMGRNANEKTVTYSRNEYEYK